MEIDRRIGRGLLARNSVFNFLGQILAMLAGILTIPYVVKGLGTNGYGILSIAYMVLGYFTIFDLGLSRATVRFVADHLNPEKAHKIPELVWTSFSVLIGLGCVGGLVGVALVPFAVTYIFKMPVSFVGEARASLLILCASMPVMLGNDALRGVLEATQRFDLVNYVKVPGSVCFYLLAAFAVSFGVKVPGVVLLLVLVRLTTAAAYLVLCFRVVPGLRSGFRISRKVIRPLASFGGWIMVSNITGPIHGYLERFLIASVLSVTMLTFYSVPFELVGKILIFPASIAPALFPYFSYHGSRHGTEVADVTSRSIKFLLLVLTPVTGIFVFFARDILRLWMGPEFATQSTMVLQLLAIALFLNAFAYIPYSSVQALGRPDLKAILDLFTLPLNALLCWLLMRWMGIGGAALGKVLITVVDTGFLFGFAWRMKAFSLRDCISGPLLNGLLASTGLVFILFSIECLHATLLVSLSLVTASLVLYGAAFWVFAIDRNERAVIKSISAPLLLTRQPVQSNGVQE